MQVKSSQVKSSQVKSSQVKSSQVKSSKAKKAVSIFLALSFATTNPVSFAGTRIPITSNTVTNPAQTVEIWGTPDCDGIASERCGWGGFGNGGGGISGEPPINGGGGGNEGGNGGYAPGDVIAANDIKSGKATDVRCAAGISSGAREVTSASDANARLLAASEVQAQINLQQGPLVNIAKAIIYAIFGGQKVITVTFADNGTEKFAVNPSNATSAPLTNAIPNSLVPGSGQAETSSSCPKVA